MTAPDPLAALIADEIWRIHGPESTDRESAEMDAEEIAAVLRDAGYEHGPTARAEAWDEGADAMFELVTTFERPLPRNPYRAARLRENLHDVNRQEENDK